MTPTEHGCDWPNCPWHPDMERRIQALEARQQAQGETLAGLQVKVAVAGGAGSLVGGGLVALAVKLIGG